MRTQVRGGAAAPVGSGGRRPGVCHDPRVALHSALWRRLDISDGLVHGALSDFIPDADHPDGAHLLDGAAVSRDEAGAWSLRFSVIADRTWSTRTVFVEVLADDGLERVTLAVDGLGEWTLDGRPWPELRGCTDVDVSATPLTNALPVNRLALPVGAEATVDVAWVDVPSLAVHRVRQVYRRGPDDARGLATYTYADPTYGEFGITVDRAGLVVAYQGLFTRVA
jgi:uncharacterized protein